MISTEYLHFIAGGTRIYIGYGQQFLSVGGSDKLELGNTREEFIKFPDGTLRTADEGNCAYIGQSNRLVGFKGKNGSLSCFIFHI